MNPSLLAYPQCGRWVVKGAAIFDGAAIYSDHALVIEGERIVALIPEEQLPLDISVKVLAGGLLTPGLIDLQINGAGGIFFTENPSVAALEIMSDTLASLGTTGFLPTVISAPADIHAAAQAAVIEARAAGNRAVLGIHLEGPFFAEAKRGCHPLAALREFDAADAARLLAPTDNEARNSTRNGASEGVRLLTLAPEKIAPALIQELVAAGNIVALGHSNADYATTQAALDAGATGFTHLFNAMSQLGGREPGVVGAALADVESWCGIICDGHHVHPASIRVALAAKGVDKLVLVSDAMATLGAAEPSFTLDGERISEREGRLVNAAGNLAGSAVSLLTCVRLAHQWAGVPLAQALKMATANPAKIIGRERDLGTLTAGTIADLLHLNDALQLQAVWRAGQLLSH